jgi:RND superfamily putative drug exporter
MSTGWLPKCLVDRESIPSSRKGVGDAGHQAQEAGVIRLRRTRRWQGGWAGEERSADRPVERPWSRPAGIAAAWLVAARWPVLVGWLFLAVAAVVSLPAVSARSGDLSDITTTDNPALAVEERSAQAFGFPLLTRTMMVQHDPAGLPDEALQSAVDHAKAVARAEGQGPVAAALPVPNDRRLPGIHDPGTTIVTYLYPREDQGFGEADAAAREYAAGFDQERDRVVGVTGTLPARAEQVRTLDSSLRLLEAASLAAVLLIMAFAFRSLAAPLLTLATGALSFVLVTRVAGLISARGGWNIPADLEPVMVALTFGITTDYVAYFLSGMRAELAQGRDRLDAARRTTATFAPIVLVAGATIVAGVSALLVARSPAIRAFGPALAVAVLISVVVAVTVIPAAMAVLGHRAVRLPRSGGGRTGDTWARRTLVRVLGWRLGALLAAVACVVGLGTLTLPVRDLQAGLPFIASLPDDRDVSRAADAATAGFAAGIVAPTLLELRPEPANASTAALGRLEALLDDEPHVAGVLGPRTELALSELTGRDPGVFARPDGSAARYLIVFDVDPLDATAVGALERLEERLPALLDRAGLAASTQHGFGGDTAAVSAVISQSNRDLRAVLAVALVVNLLIMMMFLRAVVAPLFLLGCTILSAGATLGLTTLVFQEELGHPGVTFFVPLAAGVLLLALGSDYNLFAVGHVWQEARRRRLPDAMRAALPRSSSAITIAGVALAASLGTLALVPLLQFRELAFALTVGILIDALLVRTLLVPALLTIFGRASGWPGHRLDPPPADEPAGESPAGEEPAGEEPSEVAAQS